MMKAERVTQSHKKTEAGHSRRRRTQHEQEHHHQATECRQLAGGGKSPQPPLRLGSQLITDHGKSSNLFHSWENLTRGVRILTLSCGGALRSMHAQHMVQRNRSSTHIKPTGCLVSGIVFSAALLSPPPLLYPFISSAR